VSFLVEIIALPQGAFTLVNTSIANVWGLIETIANLLLEIVAYLVAEFARRAAPGAIWLVGAKLTYNAFLAVDASVRYPEWSRLVA